MTCELFICSLNFQLTWCDMTCQQCYHCRSWKPQHIFHGSTLEQSEKEVIFCIDAQRNFIKIWISFGRKEKKFKWNCQIYFLFLKKKSILFYTTIDKQVLQLISKSLTGIDVSTRGSLMWEETKMPEKIYVSKWPTTISFHIHVLPLSIITIKFGLQPWKDSALSTSLLGHPFLLSYYYISIYRLQCFWFPITEMGWFFVILVIIIPSNTAKTEKIIH